MKALVIVDMQKDFISGSLANIEADRIVENIINLIESNQYDSIILTRDTHSSNYLNTPEGIKLPIEHCIKGTKGWEVDTRIIAAIVANKINYYYCNKRTFGTTSIAPLLQSIGQFSDITLCGTCTDICVISNALILKTVLPKVKINVKAKCCAGTTKENHESALKVMKNCQVNII